MTIDYELEGNTARAFFSEDGAEGERDPCLVIDAQPSFYRCLYEMLLVATVEPIICRISGISVILVRGEVFRSYVDGKIYSIEIPDDKRHRVLHAIAPLTHDESQDGSDMSAVKVHVFLDITDGFEVILRKWAYRARSNCQEL